MAAKDKQKNIAEKADLLLRDAIEQLGYILWDVEYKKEGSEYNLVITIDKEGVELTLDDCVAVTDVANEILDREDPIPDSYCLEVSSAGLERELRKPEHFEKYIGHEVNVKLFAPNEVFGKQFTAVIDGFNGTEVFFKNDTVSATIERSKIASVKTAVNYTDIFKNN